MYSHRSGTPSGLSPRVRGNQHRNGLAPERLRSIPACAGEPRALIPAGPGCGVYPRVCGGTARPYMPCPRLKGLSPRVRGNPALLPGHRDPAGSIPACAGEPRPRWAHAYTGWVYPRVCGGTAVLCRAAHLPNGLSPRVRGNQPESGPRWVLPGSIPACAGEPPAMMRTLGRRAVYPRVCGGTVLVPAPAIQAQGLSPRVRGNPAVSGLAAISSRSIPACAGEPSHRTRRRRCCPVYPRVCGGTVTLESRHDTRDGLSPRVRGNLQTAVGAAARNRSIPACAGEPLLRAQAYIPPTVYPRVCGGTPATASSAASPSGLSPRVRGNHRRFRQSRAGRRSIPACAGEPSPPRRRPWRRQVYPRVCGGTEHAENSAYKRPGLSPRVRGNPPPPYRALTPGRSIPACAGEPPSSSAPCSSPQVYPRVCGGTET